ncbi:MAG: hypothetical protein FD121_862 [Gallionellaceae bacterium]|nr:MAG: hypothetical protein FD121_862 [Gallionellaceae bacterium]
MELQYIQRHICQHFAHVIDRWIHKQTDHRDEWRHMTHQISRLLHADMARTFLVKHQADGICTAVRHSAQVLLTGDAADLNSGHKAGTTKNEVALYLEAGPTSHRR